MNRSVYLLVTLVAAAAAIFAANVAWADLTTLGVHGAVGLASFAALAILSEAQAIDFSVGPGGRYARSSIAFLPLLACTIVFPKAGAISAAIAVLVFEEFSSDNRAPWKFAFNLSQGVLSVGFAATVYEALGGTHAPAPGTTLHLGVIPFTGLVVTFVFTNVIAVAAFLALRQKQDFREIAHKLVSSGGNTLLGLLASPIAVFAAILYKEFYVAGLVLITLPLLLVRYSYLSKVQLEQANRDLLTVLVKAIETRDPYTSGHSVRVSRLARTIANDLDLPRRKVIEIETAGLLHDIGKIDAVYAPLINKSAALSETERAEIRTHATKGADLLQSLASLGEEVINGVRHHHERFNGTGYPDGLAGKSIPIAARIIAVCDAVDAMLSDRPYRPALTFKETQHELRRCAGSQFDPDIVRIIIERNTLERAASLVSSEDGTERADPRVPQSTGF